VAVFCIARTAEKNINARRALIFFSARACGLNALMQYSHQLNLRLAWRFRCKHGDSENVVIARTTNYGVSGVTNRTNAANQTSTKACFSESTFNPSIHVPRLIPANPPFSFNEQQAGGVSTSGPVITFWMLVSCVSIIRVCFQF
jgi:hypothetical protein